MPYHQFQIDEKGVKLRYNDPQYQMPRKDQGVAQSLIFSDLRQFDIIMGHGLEPSECCEASCALIDI